MHVDAIELFHLALPLIKPLPSPLGPRDRLETVLVGVHGGGAVGWGEASPGNAPLAGAEWAAGVFGVLRDWLAPRVVGTEVASGDALAKRLEPFRGNQFARGAIDMAWWDLHARLQGRPLHEALGGARGAIEVGLTFDQMESPDAFLAALGRAIEDGYGRLKLKLRPGWDVRMVGFVRKEFPTATLHVDCEGALGLEQMHILHRLEDFSLAMIEQPFAADDLVGHAMAQETLRTPLCLDEGITTVAQTEIALELKSCKYVNLKPGRVGGLTAAAAIHDLCHGACTPCYVGAMPQSAIASRAAFALAAKENCAYPADFFPSDEILAEDVAEPLLPARDPADGLQRVRLWTAPGIGAEPRRELLRKFCLADDRIERT